MTREEAIKELKIFSGTTRIRLSANFWEALNTVIKALEQETCEDAVSRKAIEEILITRMIGSVITFDHFIELLYKLPSVTPTRKKGKWIGDKNYPICEKCGCDIYEEYIGRSDYVWIEKPMRFCPNCGAEMEVE